MRYSSFVLEWVPSESGVVHENASHVREKEAQQRFSLASSIARSMHIR